MLLGEKRQGRIGGDCKRQAGIGVRKRRATYQASQSCGHTTSKKQTYSVAWPWAAWLLVLKTGGGRDRLGEERSKKRAGARTGAGGCCVDHLDSARLPCVPDCHPHCDACGGMPWSAMLRLPYASRLAPSISACYHMHQPDTCPSCPTLPATARPPSPTTRPPLRKSSSYPSTFSLPFIPHPASTPSSRRPTTQPVPSIAHLSLPTRFYLGPHPRSHPIPSS